MRSLLIAVAGLMLAGCATQTPYQPAANASAYGFEEQRIENNRVRITFRGNSVTDRETVENYMLYRAAELTLAGGHTYFVVANRDTEERSYLQGVGQRSAFPFSYRYFHPRYGWRYAYDPFWNEPASYREISSYEAIAEIAMFSGAKPESDPNAFDAQQVMANLQGRIIRPPVAQ